MRSAYYSDLCSKFMIENTILKMEYAEVRVFSISDKVGSGWLKKKKFTMLDPATWSEVLRSHFPCPAFLIEPDHLMSPGPAAVGYPYQSVL